jgi:hypothetical protein
MPLPAAYDENSLAAFAEAELGPLAVSLGLGEGDALPEAVNEVIGLLGHALSEETTTAGLMKVRALARWQAEAQAAIAGGGVAVVGATTTAGSPYGWAAYPEFGA